MGFAVLQNPLEAAKECLEALKSEGRLLTFGSFEFERADQSKRGELWEVAYAACKAGHDHVLQWLFCGRWQPGWPGWGMAVFFEWSTPNGSIYGPQPHPDILYLIDKELSIPGMGDPCTWFFPEVTLCRFAMQNESTTCLKALLEVGCLSDWMCPLAALEGREEHLALAAARGCTCDGRTMFVAARACNLRLLQATYQHANVQAGLHWGGNVRKWLTDGMVNFCIRQAVLGGSAECMGALLDWFNLPWAYRDAASCAGRSGQLGCLKELTRCVPSFYSPSLCHPL